MTIFSSNTHKILKTWNSQSIKHILIFITRYITQYTSVLKKYDCSKLTKKNTASKVKLEHFALKAPLCSALKPSIQRPSEDRKGDIRTENFIIKKRVTLQLHLLNATKFEWFVGINNQNPSIANNLYWFLNQVPSLVFHNFWKSCMDFCSIWRDVPMRGWDKPIRNGHLITWLLLTNQNSSLRLPTNRRSRWGFLRSRSRIRLTSITPDGFVGYSLDGGFFWKI